MEFDELTGLPTGSLVEPGTAKWPEAKRLPGRIVTLEMLDPLRHVQPLWEAVGGAHHAPLWQYLSEGPYTDRSAFADSLSEAAACDDPAFFVVVNNSNKSVVGRLALLNIRPKHRAVEVGHVLFSPELQQTAAATEAVYLLSRYIFDDLGYRRYEWKCNALNSKSRRAAERLGFSFEGIFRQHMIIKGRNRDSAWFSMLDKDWPRVKALTESWLAEENFDEQSKQRSRLSELMRPTATPNL